MIWVKGRTGTWIVAWVLKKSTQIKLKLYLEPGDQLVILTVEPMSFHQRVGFFFISRVTLEDLKKRTAFQAPETPGAPVGSDSSGAFFGGWEVLPFWWKNGENLWRSEFYLWTFGSSDFYRHKGWQKMNFTVNMLLYKRRKFDNQWLIWTWTMTNRNLRFGKTNLWHACL